MKLRSEVAQEDCWSVEKIFPNHEEWENAFLTANRGGQTPHWPELVAYQGKLGEGEQTLKALLDLHCSISRKLSLLYTYAHLKHDEELTHDLYKVVYGKIVSLLHEFNLETSWLEPELLSLSEEQISAMLRSDLLKEYRFYLEKIFRMKPHVLTPEKEELIALAGNALTSSQRAFSAINDADFKFGVVLDSKGEELELTHGSYGLFIRDQDRTLRKNAFLKLHGIYQHYENTLCELLNGQVQSHLFNARARKYSSCLEAALFPKNIDISVYHALIQAVHEKISGLHRYVDLRKRILGIDLHPYDMYVPLAAQIEMKIPYKEAEDLIIESVSPLGAEYQNLLREGLKSQRWVDRYENKNKRSGAYSSGCYDSMPYILMNYKELLRDVFTLAHEAGHSMHSLLSHKYQPYHYGDYPIFLAEVASTFNEDLLIRLLFERMTKKEEKIYLLTQKIEDIRATLYRQSLFAEFELFIHSMAEQNVPLTPKLLNEEFTRLNRFYYGSNLIIDPEGEVEWARIPHFYYDFYVYQYATGISAATALAEKVVKGGAVEREAYLSFLKGGSSRYPLDMLKVAGIDMSSPEPVQSTLTKFNELVDGLEKLLLA